MLENLFRINDYDIIWYCLMDKLFTPIQMTQKLKTLFFSLDEKIKLTQNPNTPVESLKVLATDEDPDVRFCVAQHRNTPVEDLKVLATDENWNVRYCVAQHPNTPVETLSVLATDENPDVRYWVARHPNATEIVKRLVLMTNSKRMDT